MTSSTSTTWRSRLRSSGDLPRFALHHSHCATLVDPPSDTARVAMGPGGDSHPHPRQVPGILGGTKHGRLRAKKQSSVYFLLIGMSVNFFANRYVSQLIFCKSECIPTIILRPCNSVSRALAGLTVPGVHDNVPPSAQNRVFHALRFAKTRIYRPTANTNTKLLPAALAMCYIKTPPWRCAT